MPIAVNDAAFVVVDVVGLKYIMGSGMHSLIVNAVVVDTIVGPVMHALVPLYAVNYGVAPQAISNRRSYCGCARNTAEAAGKSDGAQGQIRFEEGFQSRFSKHPTGHIIFPDVANCLTYDI